MYSRTSNLYSLIFIFWFAFVFQAGMLSSFTVTEHISVPLLEQSRTLFFRQNTFSLVSFLFLHMCV